MEQVYVRTAQKLFGPLKDFELKRLIRNGQISLQDRIWHYYQNVWVKLEQIERLRRIFEEEHKRFKATQVIAVAGCKGGVGKTSLVASMALEFSRRGKKVIAVDADFQDPDLHEWLRVPNPPMTLRHFFTNQRNALQDIVVDTPTKNLKLICGEVGNIEAANPLDSQRELFAEQLHELYADFVLVDLGPGVSYANVDLFLSCDRGVVVIEPEPSSVLSAFRFIRIAFLRSLKRMLVFSAPALELIRRFETNELHLPYGSPLPLLAKIDRIDARAGSFCRLAVNLFRPDVVMNKVISKNEIQEGIMLVHALNELLGINATYLGFIDYDRRFRSAAKEGTPFVLEAAGERPGNGVRNGKHAKWSWFRRKSRSHGSSLVASPSASDDENIVQNVFGSSLDSWPSDSSLDHRLAQRIGSYFG